MSTIYVMEAVNLFCGDDDPTKSKFLTLESLKLPALEENFTQHTPGGGSVEIEVATGVKMLTASFKLKGWDPDLLSQFGLGTKGRNRFTAYGSVRDKRTNREIEAKAIIDARLGKIEGDDFKRGDFMGYDYALNEIFHYELFFDTKQKFMWDLFTDDFRIDGIAQNATQRGILRIPGAS